MTEEQNNELSEEFESYSPASIPEIVESNDADWQRAVQCALGWNQT